MAEIEETVKYGLKSLKEFLLFICHETAVIIGFNRRSVIHEQQK